MKNILIVLVLFVMSAPALAMDDVQKKLRATPEMSLRCENRIKHFEDKVAKYEKKVNWYIARSKKPRLIDRLKLGHFRAELQDWKDYCSGKSESTEPFEPTFKG